MAIFGLLYAGRMKVELLELLGKSNQSREWKKFTASLDTTDATVIRNVFYDFPKEGIAFSYDKNAKAVSEIWLYLSGFNDADEQYSEYKPYLGQLPAGISAHDTRTDLDQKLGTQIFSSEESPPPKRHGDEYFESQEVRQRHLDEWRKRPRVECNLYQFGKYGIGVSFFPSSSENICFIELAFLRTVATASLGDKAVVLLELLKKDAEQNCDSLEPILLLHLAKCYRDLADTKQAHEVLGELNDLFLSCEDHYEFARLLQTLDRPRDALHQLILLLRKARCAERSELLARSWHDENTTLDQVRLLTSALAKDIGFSSEEIATLQDPVSRCAKLERCIRENREKVAEVCAKFGANKIAILGDSQSVISDKKTDCLVFAVYDDTDCDVIVCPKGELPGSTLSNSLGTCAELSHQLGTLLRELVPGVLVNVCEHARLIKQYPLTYRASQHGR